MRFLVDRCAGVSLARWLRQAGHDVVDAAEWPQDPGDASILAIAAAESRILVTIDTDFGVLVFADEKPHCGLVRLPDCPASSRIAIMTVPLPRPGRARCPAAL